MIDEVHRAFIPEKQSIYIRIIYKINRLYKKRVKLQQL